MPTEAAVAHGAVARYADHTPLYRQSQALARQGIEIGREVLASWMGAAAFAVRPVVARMREILHGSVRLFADETTMPALEPNRGKTNKGFAPAIARDDRPWGGTNPPAVVFHYAPGRGAEHARDLLAGYTGLLQCDGYAAYKSLAAPKDGQAVATVVYCWAHTIRTQSTFAEALGVVTGRLDSERDDMLDLQCVVVDDDALDDEPQYGLPLAGIGRVQPRADAPAERGEARQRLARLQPPAAQPEQLVVLLPGQASLLGEGPPLTRQFV
jgi:hypothetical protein